MFYLLSKLVWFVARPSNALALVLALAAVLLFTRWQRFGRWLVAGTAVLMLTIWLAPVGTLALRPLEQRFPVPEDPGHIDGIIVLGGSQDLRAALGTRRGGAAATVRGEVNEAAERLTVLPRLAARYPEAPIIFSGGGGFMMLDDPLTEADVVRQVFADLRLPETRLLYEDRSRNTWQNAAFSRAMLDPAPGSRWLLITSAFHMPRAVGCFRQAGWSGIVPYPVDFRARPFNLPSDSMAGALNQFDLAAREWVGLVVYALSGRTDAFFPAP